MQTAAAEARQRLRESRADLNNVKELRDQRLNILPAVKHSKEEKIKIGGKEESVEELVTHFNLPWPEFFFSFDCCLDMSGS